MLANLQFSIKHVPTNSLITSVVPDELIKFVERCYQLFAVALDP